MGIFRPIAGAVVLSALGWTVYSCGSDINSTLNEITDTAVKQVETLEPDATNIVVNQGSSTANFDVNGKNCTVPLKVVGNRPGRNWHFEIPEETTAGSSSWLCFDN